MDCPRRNKQVVRSGFIRETKYTTWLSNIVLVEKKISGTWRMCIDFTDLNKAWLKDSYSLLNFDKLVNAVASFEYLSFIDTHSGYNQIQMHPDD